MKYLNSFRATTWFCSIQKLTFIILFDSEKTSIVSLKNMFFRTRHYYLLPIESVRFELVRSVIDYIQIPTLSLINQSARFSQNEITKSKQPFLVVC